jgi:hypothetical protein
MTSPLPTLASVDDVQARILPRILSPAELTRAGVLLADASSQIRRFCRKDFFFHEADTVILKAKGGVIKLPYRPVTNVESVIAIAGNTYVPNIPVAWWTFDGIDEISMAEASVSGVINLPEAWYEYGAFPGTFEVTYDHGYSAVPDEVKMVCATTTISVLMAPTMAAGVIGETVGAYSYRLERGGGGLVVALTEADLAALADFRDKNGTITMEK